MYEWLLGLLKDGLLASNIAFRMAGSAGISKRTLERAKEELRISSLKSAEGWLWLLPPEVGDLGHLDELGKSLQVTRFSQCLRKDVKIAK